jgi:hypothetical protein
MNSIKLVSLSLRTLYSVGGRNWFSRERLNSCRMVFRSHGMIESAIRRHSRAETLTSGRTNRHVETRHDVVLDLQIDHHQRI